MSDESIRKTSNNHFDESLELTDEDDDEGRDDDDDEDDEEDREFQHGKISRDTSNNPPRGDTPPSNMSDSDGEYAEGDEDDEDELKNDNTTECHARVNSQRRATTDTKNEQASFKRERVHDGNPFSRRETFHREYFVEIKVGSHYGAWKAGVNEAKFQPEDESADNDLITGDDDDEISAAAYGVKDHSSFKGNAAKLSDEMKEIFQYISRYRPQEIELEPALQPFIPEYIPAIGDIDAFIKISRPDQKPESLGLSVLDEPSGKQSDPTVLDLHLRAVTKSIAPVPQVVRSIDSISLRTNTKPLDNWIRNVKELHAAKPAPSVHYSRRMPDIEDLMQVWPVEIEEALSTITLPDADLEISLPSYARLITALLDIPTPSPQQQQKENTSQQSKRKPSTTTIESLHVLFTLYSEFKNSQHFRSFGRTVGDRENMMGAQ
ncbi:Intraflagellar transport protein 46 [Chytriomyces hyalinus]|nr:Intraflagellar transport protein 46 [Chytriomyces hyalinus]